MKDKRKELLIELEIYEKALVKEKNPFMRNVLEFEIKCIKKDLIKLGE